MEMDDLDPLAGLGENQLGGEKYTVTNLKRDLHGWRHVLIPLSRVLTWEQPWHPALLFLINSFLFLVVWYLDPSVLTTIGLLGLIFCVADYTVPLVCDSLVSPESWTGEQEKQYEVICEKVMRLKTFCHDSVDSVKAMKHDKPKMYVIVMSSVLLTMAYFGYCINNLLLTYFIVTFAVMLPGLRHHGIIQKYFGQAMKQVSQLVSSASSKMKKS